jgi:hypothetical protein
MKLVTPKNACSGVTALSGGALTVIMGAVSADKLHDWRWLIIILAIVTVLASLVQMILASREDQDLIKKIEVVIAQHKELLPQQEVRSVGELPESIPAKSSPVLDGEVYRLVMSPRSIAWPLVRDLYKVQGRPDEAVIDTDILVEMYLVNRDTQTRYLRDIKLTADVNGKRVEFKRQDDLGADDFNGIDYEYGIKEGQGYEVKAINQLSNKFPMSLASGQPVEGWIRFMAKEINADKITEGTIVITIIDSFGDEYPISRVAQNQQRSGEIGLRRRLG